MSRTSFTAACEIDYGAMDRINAALRGMPEKTAGRALRNGFRAYTKLLKKTVESMAPMGRTSATEKVRGVERPNPHIKDNIATTVKGYRRGTLIWAAVGVKEIPGSYYTPHWYLRWVEFGHDVKRRATGPEMALLVSRGEQRKKNMTIRIGRVPGKFFLRTATAATEGWLTRFVEEALERQIQKEFPSG